MNARKVYSPAFLVPLLALYTVFFFVPVVVGFGYSFHKLEFHVGCAQVGLGLKNYQEIFSSGSSYAQSLVTTFWFTLATVVLKGFLGLALALMLHEKHQNQGRVGAAFSFCPTRCLH